MATKRRIYECCSRDRDKRNQPNSFEDAVNEGVARATSTLRNVEGAWVKDQNVLIENGSIVGYKVNLAVYLRPRRCRGHQLIRS